MNPAEVYILKQEEPFQSILLQLQSVILAIAPQAELLYKWRIPFYYCNGIPLCYLNKSKDYVDLVFWHGNQIDKYKIKFVAANRKSVRSLRYTSVDDINDEVVVYVLQKQLEINVNPFKTILKSKREN